MTLGLLFCVIFLISVFAYGAFNWPLNRSTGAGLIVFVLLFLLGWAVFGFVIRDDGYRSSRASIRISD